MRYYDSVITSLKYSREMLIDAKGSDYSGEVPIFWESQDAIL